MKFMKAAAAVSEKIVMKRVKAFPWACWRSEPFAMGCSFCSGNPGAGSWGKCARKSKLELRHMCFVRHERWPQHQVHVQRLQDQQDDTQANAPSKTEFRAVAAELQKRPVGDGVAMVGHAKKTRKMQWCLAEASRMRKRHWWYEATDVSTTLIQDGSNGRLTVRFRVGNDRLVAGAGYMGTLSQTQKFDNSALGLQACTMAIIHNWCTPARNPPMAKRVVDANLDVELFQK